MAAEDRQTLLPAKQPVSAFQEWPNGEPCKSICGCIGCSCVFTLLFVVGVLIWMVAVTHQTVYGNTFTWWNYYRYQGSYFSAGNQDDTALFTFMYSFTTKEEPTVGIGPGPVSRYYYGWQDVSDKLAGMGAGIKKGTLKRYNELGIQLLNDAMWPETGTIGLGFTNEDHAFVRPYLGGDLDGAKAAESKACDGSTCWNKAWLRSQFKARFSGLNTISNTDISWMISVVFHKVWLNMDISDEDAQDVQTYQTKMLISMPWAPGIVNSKLVSTVLGVSSTLDTRSKFMAKIKEALVKKHPHDGLDSDDRKLTYLASAVLDGLALAGGLSVPASINFMVALLFMENSPAAPLSLDDLAQGGAALHNFMLETVRRYAPVAGVPHWITNDNGATWVHEIPNVEGAMADPTVFPDPYAFKPGRPGLTIDDDSKSVSWAEPAVVGGDNENPNSHSCPGKQLAILTMNAFIQELALAGPWKLQTPITSGLNLYSAPAWTLAK